MTEGDTPIASTAAVCKYSTYTCSAIALGTLALPFIIGTVALHGLHDHIVTFHGSDEELNQYPIIMQFAESFPKMKLWDYDSATTPLFDVLFAVLAKFISPALPFLRAVNVVATYFASIVMFVIIKNSLGVNFVSSLLIALALILSPYVFGISFLLLTDNLALLFATCAIYFALRYVNGEGWNLIAFAALLAACAIMTRQLYLWLLILLLTACIFRSRKDPTEPLSGAFALIGLAVAPLIVLLISWGGANPPKYHTYLDFSLRPLSFFTACVGLYGAPFLAVRAWESAWTTKTALISLAVAVLLISGVLLWFGPLNYVPITPRCLETSCPPPTDGYLWRASLWFPSIGGTNLLFWILVPVGIGMLLRSFYERAFPYLDVLVYFAFGILSLSNSVLYQKYFDLPALLVCCLASYKLRKTRAFQMILVCYCGGFILYAIGNPFSTGWR